MKAKPNKSEPSRFQNLFLCNSTKGCFALAGLLAATGTAAERQPVHEKVPAAIKALNLKPTGRLPGTNHLHLPIGLPFRNPAGLTKLIRELYDPASTNFHAYLTPPEFTERFGPTEADYLAVLDFAKSNGLRVKATNPGRALVDVDGTAADIERTFHLNLMVYQHPTEARTFYAPDAEPSVDAKLPNLDINGLHNYVLPRPALSEGKGASKSGTAVGTAPDGASYMGRDFRTAYVPGVSLDGAGQIVGLVEADGFYPSDIIAYENQAGLPNVPLQVLQGAISGTSGNANNVAEVSLDIEMAISMAPGLSRVMIWQDNVMEDILSSMVLHQEVRQFSSSWSLEGATQTSEQYLQQMAAQGQSFFQASGDGDAYTGSIPWPADDPYLTSVGGTVLSMKDRALKWTNEIVWNDGYTPPAWPPNGNGYWGSGGGISPNYPIPFYQQGVNVRAAGGSGYQRNFPDVALTANNIWVVYFNGQAGSFRGTSCAAPLWAGFTALVNQQAAAHGKPSVGFLNPAIYAIGQSSFYTNCFHDITNGNSAWSGSAGLFSAAPGYDLCTGWGTPAGQSLIDALEAYAGPVFVDFGAADGGIGSYWRPFNKFKVAADAANAKATIIFKTSGSSSKTNSITKPMTIQAIGGPVTLTY